MANLFRKIFSNSNEPPPPQAEGPDDPIVPVPIPDLIFLLSALEKNKGSPLTETEVLEARDGAVCITMLQSERERFEAERGYSDIDITNPWPEWQVVREWLAEQSTD